jgi:hypothetical protein
MKIQAPASCDDFLYKPAASPLNHSLTAFFTPSSLRMREQVKITELGPDGIQKRPGKVSK